MLSKQRFTTSIWLRNFVVILILVGIIFRFYNLDRKVYWYDETMTSLRISGHVQSEWVATAFDGSVTSVGELRQTFQSPQQSTLGETMAALDQHPEHSPLYYLMARLWMQSLGHSVATTRLLSVLISMLAIPCAYWLGVELFFSPVVGWMAAALISISPFHVLYAQEAREWALWTVMIVLSSANLLWAVRRERLMPWLMYGIVATLGLYTHPFSGLVSISHGIYVFGTEKLRLTQSVIGYCITTLLSLLLFAPWLYGVLTRFDLFVDNTASVNLDQSGRLPLFWLLNLSRVFFDLNQGPSAINPLYYLIALLAIASLVFVCRQAPRRASVFIIALVGVTGLALIGPDVILGERRSSITPYAIPSYVGLQLAIAYFLTAQITARPHNIRAKYRARRRWRYLAIFLAVCGVISCAVSSQMPVWWHKSDAKSRRNLDVAAVINQAEQPLVVSDELSAGRILALSHLLRSDVQLQLAERPAMIEVPEEFETVFLYLPSNRLKQWLENQQDFTIEPIELENEVWLWRVSNP